eukprot:2585501-Rhodomonas_salina.5
MGRRIPRPGSASHALKSDRAAKMALQTACACVAFDFAACVPACFFQRDHGLMRACACCQAPAIGPGSAARVATGSSLRRG